MTKQKFISYIKTYLSVVFISSIAMMIGLYAFYKTYNLFSTELNEGFFPSVMAAVSSVGTLFALLACWLTATTHRVKGMATMLMLFWTFLVFSVLSVSVVGSERLFKIDAFAQIGGYMAAALPAIAVIPVICMSIAYGSKASDYTSSTAAISAYTGIIVKIVAFAASTFSSTYFGAQKQMAPELSAFLGLILEVCCIWSVLQMVRSKEEKDKFDTLMWGGVSLFSGSLIGLVAIETISTLANVKLGFMANFAEYGLSIYVSSIGIVLGVVIITTVLTKIIDVKEGKGLALWPTLVGAFEWIMGLKQTKNPTQKFAADNEGANNGTLKKAPKRV